MKKTIEKIVEYAVWVAEPDKVILFGSMAQGTNNVHSDLDLLIIVDKDVQVNQMSRQIAQFAKEFALTADVLIYSQTELESAFEKPASFLASIFKSGKIIYQKRQKSL